MDDGYRFAKPSEGVSAIAVLVRWAAVPPPPLINEATCVPARTSPATWYLTVRRS